MNRTAEQKWMRHLWCYEHGRLANYLDWPFLRPFLLDGSIYDMPVRVIRDKGYPTSLGIGTKLASQIGPSVVEVAGMPTRKKLRLRIVSASPENTLDFEWKRDLLLPFWNFDPQRSLF